MQPRPTQEFAIDPGLPLQARKACKQKGGKKFTKQHYVDSNGEDSGKGKFPLAPALLQ